MRQAGDTIDLGRERAARALRSARQDEGEIGGLLHEMERALDGLREARNAVVRARQSMELTRDQLARARRRMIRPVR